MNATFQSNLCRILTIALAATLLATISTTRVAAQVPDEDVARIREAIPSEPSVRVFKPRRLLLFSLCKGFRHSSIPHGVVALTLMGEKTGVYVAEASEDIDVFKKENLAQYDGVVFLNSTGTLFEDETLRENLLEFIESGKGIIGIHAATDCFYDWEEFGRLMGGYFDGHPWHANTTVTLKIEEPDHPVCAAFDDRNFTITDEIYQFKDPYSRSRLRVLTSLDTEKTDMTLPGIKRTDDDFAVSWVREYGDGRLFYCSLGHREDVYWNPTVLRHYLDGIQFALGDLPAPAEPRRQGEAVEDDAHGSLPAHVRDAMTAVVSYEFGQSRRPLSVVEEYVQSVVDNSQARDALEQEFLRVLESDSATHDARAFVCRQLALAGGLDSVSALSTLLHETHMTEYARYALERIPGDAADRALINALDLENPTLLAGVINSLGKRGTVSADEKLIEILNNSTDFMLRTAAADALASIGSEPAASALVDLMEEGESAGDEDLYHASVNALLRLADRFAEQGRPNRATAVCESLLLTDPADDTRIACIQRLALTNSETAFRYIIAELNFGQSDMVATAAAGAIELMQRPRFLSEVNEAYSKLETERGRVMVIEAVGRRGEIDGGTFLMRRFHDGSSDTIVEAAVEAMGELGMAGSHMILAQTAAEKTGSLQAAARQALYRLDHPSTEAVDRQIARRVESRVIRREWRAELLRALGVRGATEEVLSVFVALQDSEPVVRIAAWDAIGQLAGAAHLDRLFKQIRSIDDSKNPEEAEAASTALIAIATRLNESGLEALADLGIAAVERVTPGMKARLLPVLARTKTNEALSTLIRYYRQPDSAAVQSAAIEALASWHTAAAADTLYAILAETSNADHRGIAFQGYIDVTLRDEMIRPESTAALFARLMPQIQNDAEARAAIRGLAEVNHPDAIQLVQSYLTTGNLKSDAADAMLSIANAVSAMDRSAAKEAVKAVLAVAGEDSDLRERAGATLNRIEQGEDFVHAWVYSGPYKEKNMGGGELMTVAFAPEPDGQSAASTPAWKPVPSDALNDPRFVDFLAIHPDSDACMYLKTRIYVPERTDARLEIGSDDGVKAWLNSKVVHVNNVMRGMTIGADVVNVKLNEGWNTLLLKVTQGGGDWRACCRVRDANGFHIEGIRFETP